MISITQHNKAVSSRGAPKRYAQKTVEGRKQKVEREKRKNSKQQEQTAKQPAERPCLHSDVKRGNESTADCANIKLGFRYAHNLFFDIAVRLRCAETKSHNPLCPPFIRGSFVGQPTFYSGLSKQKNNESSPRSSRLNGSASRLFIRASESRYRQCKYPCPCFPIYAVLCSMFDIQ